MAPVYRRHLNPQMSFKRNMVSPYLCLKTGRKVARQSDGDAGKGSRKKRRPDGNSPDRGSNFAPTRKGADFRQVSNDDETVNRLNEGR